MWNGEDESSIGDLPPEIITKIINFLPHDDKKACRSVSFQWNYIVSNLCNNMKFTAHLDNVCLDHFLISNLIFDVVYMEGLTKRFPRMSHPKNHFPNIKDIQIRGPNSQAATMNILKYGLNDTTSLHIDKNTLQFVPRSVISGNIRDFKWKKLMKFMLNVEVEEDKNHLDSCSTLLKYSKMTSLREFEFDFVDNGDIKNRKIQIKRLFLNMYTFLFNNSRSLKDLIFSIHYGGKETRWYEMLKVESSMPKNSIGCNMNIETCKLSMTGSVRSLGLDYLISPNLIGSNLKNLSIDYWCGFNDGNVGNYFEEFLHVFEANVKTLQRVKITGGTRGTINLVWLKDCSSLTSLDIRAKDLILPEKCKFSHPLQLNVYNTDASCNEYQELFVKIGDKLEHLQLGIRMGPLRSLNLNLLWINSYTGLKYLSLNLDNQLLLSNKNLTLPNLISFQMYFHNNRTAENQMDYKWSWVKECMPNLENLKMYACGSSCIRYGLTASLTCLQIIFPMKKLKKIYFEICVNFGYVKENFLIMKHCEDTPGLSIKKIHLPSCFSQLANEIKIDRSTYKINGNKNSNQIQINQ